MITSNRRTKLFKKLESKKFREAFIEETINENIPFQIKALREQNQLTQKDFERKSGMKQTQISRLENPNYSSFTLATLKKIASIYDVGLIVRFVSMGDLISLDSEPLEVLSYKDDPYFKGVEKEKTATSIDKVDATICTVDLSTALANVQIPDIAFSEEDSSYSYAVAA